MKACLFVVVSAMMVVLVWPPSAAAESDTLLPISFASLVPDFKKAASKISLRETLTTISCLDGGKDKRTVCTYKLGDFMQISAETKTAEKEIVGLTMICTAGDNYLKNAKCLLAYAAAMMMTPRK